MFRKGFLAAAALAALLAPSSAHALTFTVNSTVDADAEGSTGNGECRTDTIGQCTLRAAIKEAYGTSGPDEVVLGPQEYLLTEDALLLIDEDSVQGMTIRGAGARATTMPGRSTPPASSTTRGPAW